MTLSVVALIPARSGSKRVPDKNIRRLGAHPLLAYTIAAARASGLFSAVICSTDAEHYGEIARYYGVSLHPYRGEPIVKKFILLTLAFAAASQITAAWAEPAQSCCRGEPPRWYAGMSGSLVFLQDSDLDESFYGFPYQNTVGYKVGYGVSGTVGYRIYPNIRGELEIAERVVDVDTFDNVSYTPPDGKYTAEKNTALMANLYYDWHNASSVTPYLGAGIGEAMVKVPLQIIVGGETKTLKGWTEAYQFMAGINYEIDTNVPVEINFGYRYFATSDITVKYSTLPGSITFNSASQNLELGARMFF